MLGATWHLEHSIPASVHSLGSESTPSPTPLRGWLALYEVCEGDSSEKLALSHYHGGLWKTPDGGGVLISSRADSGVIPDFLQPSANLCLPGQKPGAEVSEAGRSLGPPRSCRAFLLREEHTMLILLTSCVGLLLYTV